MTNTRCIKCNSALSIHNDLSIHMPIVCTSCGENYPTIESSPYIGYFTKNDLQGLFEIAAVAVQASSMTCPDFALFETICAKFHETGNIAAVQATLKESSTYFPFRYGEWLLLRGLLAGIDLHGKTVLDVGAGVGFDAWRLVQRGASVTALEYNPSLLTVGQRNLPEATWIGGISHVLPFIDSSFDMVVCNAALHHMRDIPAAMEEFLRVLKPGGIMLTACDSFSPDTFSEQDMLRAFDASPEVLLGVNEQSPRACDFLATLKRHRNALDIEIFTTVTYDHLDHLGLPMTYYAQWDFDEALNKLGTISGSLAVRARRSDKFSAIARTEANPWLDARTFLEICNSDSGATAFLARYIPKKYINLPLPLPTHDKFLQVNGWRCANGGQTGWHEAYGRANLFLRRQANETTFAFEIEALEEGSVGQTPLSFSINGKKLASTRVTRGIWHLTTLFIGDLPAHETFVMTITIEVDGAFPSRLFRVRSARFTQDSTPCSVKALGQGSTAGLAALAATCLADKTSVNVLCLPGQNNIFKHLSALRGNTTANINLIVPDNMAWLLGAEPGVKITAAYPVTTKGLRQVLVKHGPPDIVLLPYDAPQNASWLRHIMTLNIPTFDCNAGKFITVAHIESQKTYSASTNCTFMKLLKKNLPLPVINILKRIKSGLANHSY